MRIFRELTFNAERENMCFKDCCSRVIINGKEHYCYVYYAYGNIYLYTEEDLYKNISFEFKLRHNSVSDFDVIVGKDTVIFTGNLKEILDTFRTRPFYK